MGIDSELFVGSKKNKDHLCLAAKAEKIQRGKTIACQAWPNESQRP